MGMRAGWLPVRLAATAGRHCSARAPMSQMVARSVLFNLGEPAHYASGGLPTPGPPHAMTVSKHSSWKRSTLTVRPAPGRAEEVAGGEGDRLTAA